MAEGNSIQDRDDPVVFAEVTLWKLEIRQNSWTIYHIIYLQLDRDHSLLQSTPQHLHLGILAWLAPSTLSDAYTLCSCHLRSAHVRLLWPRICAGPWKGPQSLVFFPPWNLADPWWQWQEGLAAQASGYNCQVCTDSSNCLWCNPPLGRWSLAPLCRMVRETCCQCSRDHVWLRHRVLDLFRM